MKVVALLLLLELAFPNRLRIEVLTQLYLQPIDHLLLKPHFLHVQLGKFLALALNAQRCLLLFLHQQLDVLEQSAVQLSDEELLMLIVIS